MEPLDLLCADELFCFDEKEKKDDIFRELYILLVQNITKGKAAAAACGKLKENGQINKQHSARAPFSRLIAYICTVHVQRYNISQKKKKKKKSRKKNTTRAKRKTRKLM